MELREEFLSYFGSVEYRNGTENGQHTIQQSELEQWSDIRLDCLFSFLGKNPEIDLAKDPIALDSFVNLLNVYQKRHPIEPDLLEASKQRVLDKLHEWMNKKGES